MRDLKRCFLPEDVESQNFYTVFNDWLHIQVASVQMDLPNMHTYEGYRKQKSELVPHKYSRDSWFNFCMERIAGRIKEVAKNESSDSLVSELFEIMEDLLLAVDRRSKTKEESPYLLDVLSALLPLVESKSLNVRKRAQSLFSSILHCLDYEYQANSLCQIFRSVAARELEVEMEPQVLAWLMDLFRRKLSLGTEEELCHQVFRANLSSFYDLVGSLVYEDMVLASQFYVAALLLMEEQALHSLDLLLLRNVKRQLLDNFQSQLSEFSRLKEIQLKADPIVQQEMFSLELLKFTVIDVGRKIDKALSSSK